MLTFRTSTILFIIVSVISWLLQWPAWIWWLLVMVYLVLLVLGSMRIRSNFYIKAVCSGSNDGKKIAISFDDGPLPEYTLSILEILEREKVPACFFCIGNRVDQHPEIARTIVDQGHIIGNHSYTHHALFDLYGAARMKEELEQTNRCIRNATGKLPAFFRPPYGVTNPNLASAVKKTRMTTIGWNIRSLDTVARDDKKLLDKLWKELRPGAVILFHDTMAITAAILPAFLAGVRERGFEIIPIDELINEDAYA